MSDERKKCSLTIKLASLEENINPLSKENEHLVGEIECYQKVTET